MPDRTATARPRPPARTPGEAARAEAAKYRGIGKSEIARRHRRQRVERLIRSCLAKDPETRIQTAHDVALRLESIAAGESGSAAPALAAVPRPRRKRLGLTAAGIAGIGAAAFLGLRPGGRALPATEAASVVVLPCQVFAPAELGFLTDAVPSTLSTFLGQVPGLDTRRPPTSFEIDPVRLDLERVARAYRVGACVTCSVTAEADRLLLAVQLVEPATRRQLWTEAYEGTRSSYVELVRRAAEGVRQALRPGPSEALPASARSPSSETELAYRMGMYHLNRYNNLREERDFDLAFQAFQEVLDRDPRLADAAAEIAILELWRQGYHAGPAEADAWARRALEIDPRCSRAWTALALGETVRPRLDPAVILTNALNAARYDPADPLPLWSLSQAFVDSSMRLALAAQQESTRLDPLYAWGYVGQANDWFSLGRSDRALVEVAKALEIEPSMPAGLLFQAVLLADRGQIDPARARIARVLAETKGIRVEDLTARIGVDLATSDLEVRRRASAEVARLLERQSRNHDLLNELTYYVVPFLVHGGDDQRELGWRVLSRYLEVGGTPAYDWLMLSPQTEPLRRDRRFAPLAERSRARFLERRAYLVAAGSRGELPEFLHAPLGQVSHELGLEEAAAPRGR